MQGHTKQLNIACLVLASALLAMPARAETVLSSDELKALISDKTVAVTRARDGAQWKVYFAADGSQVSRGAINRESRWWIDEDGRHCNAGVRLKCAQVVDKGDGTYARIKRNGEPAVIWTSIVDGRQL